MERKKKLCKGRGRAEGYGCGNTDYLFGWGLCFKCYRKWLRETKPKKSYFRKPTGEKEMFEEIWNERTHVSFLTDVSLDKYMGSPFYFSLFAHVLSKKHFPLKRLDKDNIVLLTPREHVLFDQGTNEEREEYEYQMKQIHQECRWKELYALVDKLKRQP